MSAASPVRRPRIRLSLSGRAAIQGYMFIAPWFLGFLVFMAWPLLDSFRLSFARVTEMVGVEVTYVGFSNYVEALVVDTNFVSTLLGTFLRNLIDVPFILIFSLLVALLVNKRMPGHQVFKVLLFLPVVIGSGILVKELYTKGMSALPVLSRIDIPGITAAYAGPIIASQVAEFMNRVVFVLWRTGVQILILIAGLQGISRSLYEAARCDGATDWESFWKITLPMLSPVILVNVIYTIVDSFTDVFNEVLFYIKQVAFGSDFRIGYGAALGWMYFLVIFILVLAVLRWTKGMVFYAGER